MVSPPYDQFNPELEKIFFAKSPFNIAHLILPKPEGLKTPSGVEGDSWQPYEEIRSHLAGWLADKVIVPDEKSGIYVYQITFREGGRERQNLGFFALGKLEEYLERGVAPHENILAAPREDRLKLRISTQADFGPVYLLYRDPEKDFENLAASVVSLPPLAEIKDMYGELHQLWGLPDSSQVKSVTSKLSACSVLIADGHHRYDAALESYRRNPDKPWFAYRMMAFFNSEGGGLSIRPIHRIISGLKFSGRELLGRLSENFEIETVYAGGSVNDFEKAMNRLGEAADRFHRIGVLMEDIFYLASTPRTEFLDVEILDRWVFKNALGLSDEEALQFVDYSKDAGEVRRLVGEGKAGAGFILSPIRVDEIWKKVEQGEKLPPKSTFFYPKLLTGLVMNINSEFYKYNDD